MLEIRLDGQLEIGLSISSRGASDDQYARKPHSEDGWADGNDKRLPIVWEASSSEESLQTLKLINIISDQT